MEMKPESVTNQKSFSLLDPKAFDNYFGGVDRKISTSLYLKTANIFLKNIEDRIQSLTAALTTHDQHAATVVAHQLKGSLLSLGGNTLADLFRQIEMSIGLTPDNELLTILQTKKAEIQRFNEELKTWMVMLERPV